MTSAGPLSNTSRFIATCRRRRRTSRRPVACSDGHQPGADAHMSEPVDYASDFDPVQAAEREWLARRRQAANLPAAGDDCVGLAFSGGGIRSATFNLGVLQALEAGGMLRHVDYLSSVSGGGYAASCYTWLRARLAVATGVFRAPLVDSAGSVLDWLRAHG